jgi:hypothetical protein
MAKLIPLGDVAALLRVSVDQVLGFVLDGELRYVNVGRGYKRLRRIRQDDDEHKLPIHNHNIGPGTPLRLDRAVELAFPARWHDGFRASP